MTEADRERLERRVLVLAPTSRDANLTSAVLGRAGMECVFCSDLEQVCLELAAGAGVALLPEEAVVPEQYSCLTDWLASQPPWSDLPLLVLARRGADSGAVAQAMDLLGNVTVLERPIRVAALVSAVRVALRARQRQYQIRDHLAEWERSNEAKARLAAIVASSDDAIISKSLDGVIRSWNAGAERIFGYSASEAIGQSITMLIPPERRQEEVSILERLRAGERIEHFETVRAAKDGRHIDVSLAVSPVRDVAGAISGASTVARDITELKRAQQSLAASEQRFRSIFQSVGVSLWEEDFSGVKAAVDTLRAQGITDYGRYFEEHPEFVQQAMAAIRVLDVNDATVAMFEARDKRELLGSLPKIFVPESMSVFVRELVAVAEGQTYLESEARLSTIKGNALYVFFTMVLPDPGQPYNRVLFSLLDISARKRAEEALRDADRRKDEFLAILAHELRNPLAPIRNSLHILRLNSPHDPALQRVAEMMERQVNQMVRLVDDLMEVSRISRGKIELRKEPVEVAAVVRSAVETSRPLIEAGGHQLALEIPPEPLTLDGDFVRLTQAVANLLNNAAKYSNAGGQISLAVRREGNGVAISVRDAGIGIPPDTLPRVFDLFMQVDRRPSRTQGGLGIGLTLVKSLVEMHGGSVQARSEGAGRGSEFVVRLPLRAAGHPTELPAQVVGPPPVLTSGRVLIVDDNHDAAESLGMLLKLLGAEVHIVYSGADALEALATYKPAAVVLDVGMPGMDGHEVARRIRQQPEFQDVTLIALTGWGQVKDRDRSQTAGFDYHLIKPADVDVLQNLLTSLERRSRAR